MPVPGGPLRYAAIIGARLRGCRHEDTRGKKEEPGKKVFITVRLVAYSLGIWRPMWQRIDHLRNNCSRSGAYSDRRAGATQRFSMAKKIITSLIALAPLTPAADRHRREAHLDPCCGASACYHAADSPVGPLDLGRRSSSSGQRGNRRSCVRRWTAVVAICAGCPCRGVLGWLRRWAAVSAWCEPDDVSGQRAVWRRRDWGSRWDFPEGEDHAAMASV